MNENIINIKVVAKDMASSVLGGVKNTVNGLLSPFKAVGNAAKGLFNVLNTIPGILGAISVTDFFKNSVTAAQEYEKTLISLELVTNAYSDSVHASIKEVQGAATALGKELRIGTNAAADALQNLIKSGLSLDQASELMRRFTNEAITGKSESISLADAVKNLSFAYQTQNSALGNLSGLSENWSDIMARGREVLQAQGVDIKEITDDMAKWAGTIDITNKTLGASERFVGTLTDTQADMAMKVEELQIKIGSALTPILNELLITLSDLFDQISPLLLSITDWIQKNPELVENIIKLVAALAGLFIIEKITTSVWGLVSSLVQMATTMGGSAVSGISTMGSSLAGLAGAAGPFALIAAAAAATAIAIGKMIDDVISAQEAADKAFAAGAKTKQKEMQRVADFLNANPQYKGKGITTIGKVIEIQQSGAKLNAFAKGGDFITNGPQQILVGDNPSGKEHVQITPLDGMGSTSSNRNIAFTVNNYGNQFNENMLMAKAAFLINGA